mgnify:FL=1
MSEVKVDTISERTAAGGVTIDGVLVKDGVATFQTAAGSPLVFEGATANAFETTFAITDPTADRTITFPDADVTLGAAEDNTPAFFAYLTANQTVTDNTATKLACNGELFDTASAYDNSTNYRFTVPAGEGGKYVVTSQISYINGNASGAVIKTMIYVGGVEKAHAYEDLVNNTYEDTVLMCQTILVLSAADYVEAYGLWDIENPGTPGFGGNASSMSSYFSAFKLAGA